MSGMLAFTWAAFQCNRDETNEPLTAGLDDEWDVNDSHGSDACKNTVFTYACALEEQAELNIYDFLAGHISNSLINSGDGCLRLRQALFDM